MKTLREKITFVLTALAYVLFHLVVNTDHSIDYMGTLKQMATTAPYALGLAYIVAVFFRHYSGKGWLPWDRIARVFFTVGILFGFYLSLYHSAARRLPPEVEMQKQPSTVEKFYNWIKEK
ncbi:hypothetical protein JWJ90_16050 [Desulfobulbus rhabdoformis]|jgi:amino acid transporter|uniref:hypothetical protein n=1 Tax=Desulfobulbus rhabdoformis TaxID=34032 RepID=UPI001963DB6F|nr:hypothetical protein [Desulfobulbus rhabdoformis]MBM9615781.1 hypothetical protein [Desulfobulbus rhabdoformis]